MKWYDDIRDEMVITALSVLGAMCVVYGQGELAGVAVTGLVAFLKKEKKANAEGAVPETP